MPCLGMQKNILLGGLNASMVPHQPQYYPLENNVSINVWTLLLRKVFITIEKDILSFIQSYLLIYIILFDLYYKKEKQRGLR